jgi:hypothetical protein
LNVAYQQTRASIGNPNEGSPLINTYGMPQLVPVYDIKGNFASPANFNLTNKFEIFISFTMVLVALLNALAVSIDVL